ncbi:MAG: outer membrane beta-barrel protein [Deltaproteobacteria bacterium]|nr:outer membrane beta-barrel protein [Deltaproteobacteria bacterium]
MKRIILFFAVLAVCSGFVGQAQAEEGWHKGFYVQGNIGMTQVNNDTHLVTNVEFAKKTELSYGLTLGWDVNDWIGPFFTAIYSTATSTVGTATGAAGAFPAATFPSESAREHVADVTLGARATLPYFIDADWQPESIKFIPYAKLGGTAHGLFVNASTDANKVGAFGGGPSLGAGIEAFIWKGLIVSVDFMEHLIFQKEFRRTIAGTDTAVTEGGFKPRFSVQAGLGWHF